jgi:hypothetical protein
MDKQTSALEHNKATKPHHNQNNRENHKHGNPAFFLQRVSRIERDSYSY